jgi:hypothetical protein
VCMCIVCGLAFVYGSVCGRERFLLGGFLYFDWTAQEEMKDQQQIKIAPLINLRKQNINASLVTIEICDPPEIEIELLNEMDENYIFNAMIRGIQYEYTTVHFNSSFHP